jgi:hypothetical protein
MSRSTWRELRVALFPMSAIGLGGLAAYLPIGWPRSHWILGPIALAALAILGRGAYLAAKRARRVQTLAALYPIILVLCDPFLFVGDTLGVVWSIALLAPVVAGLLLALRQEGPWLVWGAWLVLFGSATVLRFNATHRGQGIGFFSSWIS